jgi:hypothetical protein
MGDIGGLTTLPQDGADIKRDREHSPSSRYPPRRFRGYKPLDVRRRRAARLGLPVPEPADTSGLSLAEIICAAVHRKRERRAAEERCA